MVCTSVPLFWGESSAVSENPTAASANTLKWFRTPSHITYICTILTRLAIYYHAKKKTCYWRIINHALLCKRTSLSSSNRKHSANLKFLLKSSSFNQVSAHFPHIFTSPTQPARPVQIIVTFRKPTLFPTPSSTYSTNATLIGRPRKFCHNL